MPSYSLIEPNTIESGHDPLTATGGTSQIGNIDQYLSSFMAVVQQSPQYQDGSLVVMITFDEGSGVGPITGEDAAGENCADPNISVQAVSCQIKTWIVGRYVPNYSPARSATPLEGGVAALLVASGQSAETLAILNIASVGDHIVSSPRLYGGTYNLFHYTFPKLGIEVSFVENPDDPQSWRDAVRPNTKAFFGESLANPKSDFLDIETVAAIATRTGCR